MIRRLKIDVLTELPTKTRQRVFMETEIGCMKRINMFIKKIQKWDKTFDKNKEKDDPFAFISEEMERLTGQGEILNDPVLIALNDRASYLSAAYSETGKAKIKGVINFMKGLIDNKQKFLIFGHHYEVLDAIEDY
jgi:SWI/SNF-related matrix-associated actin-dependent regulator of chromatin subfamily A-like protein 1